MIWLLFMHILDAGEMLVLQMANAVFVGVVCFKLC
jgi:hypothetical protein